MLFHLSCMAMLAMLHHHQHRMTPSHPDDQNLGGTERHFCARSEGRKSENRIMPAMIHHHQRSVTSTSSHDEDLCGWDRAAFLHSIRRQDMATIRSVSWPPFVRCLGGSCDAPSYRAPTLQQTQACAITDTHVEEDRVVCTMAARYKVLGTETKATSQRSEGLVVPAWDG
jgi:hypothetical protein